MRLLEYLTKVQQLINSFSHFFFDIFFLFQFIQTSTKESSTYHKLNEINSNKLFSDYIQLIRNGHKYVSIFL